MRRIEILRAVAMAGLALFFGAAPALATPANFASGLGFLEAGLEGLDGFTIGGDDTVYSAGEVGNGFAVELTGSDNICILFGDSTCLPNTITTGTVVDGPFSVIVAFEVTAVPAGITGPFTLLLSGLAPGAYSAAEVQVELDPVVPVGLDAGDIPGFAFDGSFDPFVRVYDEFEDAYYLGWTVSAGDVVAFQYDVLVDPMGRSGVPLMANATPVVIPEPGATVLMALGLVGLASVGRERRSVSD